MNSISGTIASVNAHGNLSLVEVQTGECILKSVVIETPETVDYLKKGSTVRVLFKETEVVVGKSAAAEISIQNRLPCTLKEIDRGRILSRLKMTCAAGEIVSIVTTQAVEQLGFKEGDPIVAMVKTNEVMLSR